MENIEMKKYGTTKCDGTEYTLTGDADHTGRDIETWGYSHRGEHDGHYQFEMSAPAVDADGNLYTVYWIFDHIEDADLDDYDYDSASYVETREE